MSRRKKDKDSGTTLKTHEEHTFVFGDDSSRIVITGPDTEISHYKMADHNPQTGLTWSFSVPGLYTVRYMNEYGVEFDTEEIEVK